MGNTNHCFRKQKYSRYMECIKNEVSVFFHEANVYSFGDSIAK